PVICTWPNPVCPGGGALGHRSGVHTFATPSPRRYHNSLISTTQSCVMIVSSSTDNRPWCLTGHARGEGRPHAPPCAPHKPSSGGAQGERRAPLHVARAKAP